MYRLFADTAVFVHFAFIVFVLAGGLLVLRWPRIAWAHLPAVIWGALVEIEGWICPLTPLENRFRELSGGATYEGDFLTRHLLRLMYPERLTPKVQWLLGGAVVLVNALVYGIVWSRRRRAPAPGR